MLVYFFKALGMLQQSFEQLLEEKQPDCIVADMFLSWASEAANNYGIPRLVFHGTSNFSISVAENVKRYAPHQKVTSDSEMFVVPGLPDKIEITKSQLINNGDNPTANPISEVIAKIQETEVKSFGVLMNSFYELEAEYVEYYQKVMGRRTWNIGPVSLYNRNIMNKAQRGKKSFIDEHQCLSWLDSKEPDSVLYVCFGSTLRLLEAQLYEIALGLEASEVPFIWVVRTPESNAKAQLLPEGFEERIEGKGLIIREWAPQLLILEHPSVGGFMTHCGWNSTLEGISAGVPLITWPMFAEHFNNEKLVTQVLKIGITAGNKVWNAWVEARDVSVQKERVKDLVNQLMGDGKEARDMRRRAQELGEKAKRAVEQGGSSYNELSSLIEELRLHSQQGKK